MTALLVACLIWGLVLACAGTRWGTDPDEREARP